ncbi:MAG TPA: PDGLE domain-containing protein [Nocardioidaceae bacterium]|nr:PDGLE domain-containing protein [Nocardioidaceae bacterium]
MNTDSATTDTGRSRRTKLFLLGGLFVALALAGIGSYYASNSPDGLTKVSEDHGFASSQTPHHTGDAPLAGYQTKDVDNSRLSGGVAGVIGVGVTFAIAGGAALLIRRRARSADDTSNGSDSGDSGDAAEVEASRS